jgi:hypothetical protein
MRRVPIHPQSADRRRGSRRGAATLDYVLVLGVVFALASLIVPLGMRIVRAAYDMMNVLISWPFL